METEIRTVHFNPRAHRHHGLLSGVMLAMVGGLLFMRENGSFGDIPWYSLWPVLVIWLGLGRLVDARGLWSVVWGLGFVGFGGAMLASNLQLVDLGGVHLWPLALVLLGAGVAVSPFIKRPVPTFSSSGQGTDDDYVQRQVTMGSSELRVTSKKFRGGSINNLMGNMELDLRDAVMLGDQAVLEMVCTMGNIELTVPPTWRVVADMAPGLGSVFENRSMTPPDAQGPKLVIRGIAKLSAVSVRN